MSKQPDSGSLWFTWPDKRLSPNARIDRREKASLVKAERERAFVWTRNALLEFDMEADLVLWLTFYPPDNRRRDLDNLHASFKPLQDGIMQAIGVDDSKIKRVILDWGPVMQEGEVRVRFGKFMPRWEEL